MLARAAYAYGINLVACDTSSLISSSVAKQRTSGYVDSVIVRRIQDNTHDLGPEEKYIALYGACGTHDDCTLC